MKFLLLLFLVFLFMVFALGFSVVRFIFRFLFGGSKMGQQQSSREQRNKTNYTSAKNNSPKVFPKDEGEYVDYEEV